MADIVRRHANETFQPIPVIEHATFAQVAAVMARRLEMPEIEVQQVPTRTYPKGGLAAHLFGYVGEVSEAQLARAEYADLQPGAIVGQAGLERTYNPQLMGRTARASSPSTARGGNWRSADRTIRSTARGCSSRSTTTCSARSKRRTRRRTSPAPRCSSIRSTGEILAMTSQPEYDPNDFANGIDGAASGISSTTDPAEAAAEPAAAGHAIRRDRRSRSLMAIAALSEGVITPDFKVYCPGASDVLRPSVSLRQEGRATARSICGTRIEQSCNVYFYNVASG